MGGISSIEIECAKPLDVRDITTVRAGKGEVRRLRQLMRISSESQWPISLLTDAQLDRLEKTLIARDPAPRERLAERLQREIAARRQKEAQAYKASKSGVAPETVLSPGQVLLGGIAGKPSPPPMSEQEQEEHLDKLLGRKLRTAQRGPRASTGRRSRRAPPRKSSLRLRNRSQRDEDGSEEWDRGRSSRPEAIISDHAKLIMADAAAVAIRAARDALSVATEQYNASMRKRRTLEEAERRKKEAKKMGRLRIMVAKKRAMMRQNKINEERRKEADETRMAAEKAQQHRAKEKRQQAQSASKPLRSNLRVQAPAGRKGLVSIALDVRRPWSQMLLRGDRTIECRSYPIPQSSIGHQMLILETMPSPLFWKSKDAGVVPDETSGKFVGCLVFESCREYLSHQQWEADCGSHRVDPAATVGNFGWDESKPMFGWVVAPGSITIFSTPVDPRTYGLTRQFRSIFHLAALLDMDSPEHAHIPRGPTRKVAQSATQSSNVSGLPQIEDEAGGAARETDSTEFQRTEPDAFLKKIHEVFNLAEHEKGQLEESALKSILTQALAINVGGSGRRKTKRIRRGTEMARLCFERSDVDMSGDVDFHEFAEFVLTLVHGVFNSLDTRRTNAVSFQNLKVLMTYVLGESMGVLQDHELKYSAKSRDSILLSRLKAMNIQEGDGDISRSKCIDLVYQKGHVISVAIFHSLLQPAVRNVLWRRAKMDAYADVQHLHQCIKRLGLL